MATNERLIQFVREALVLGRSRQDVRNALANAGWSAREIDDGLAAFAATDFNPPVPRPRVHMTARDTFIYLVLFTSLTIVATYLITLISAILTMKIPDPSDSSWTYAEAIDQTRWAIAALAVSTPVFVWMTLLTRRQIARDSGQRRSPTRKWLTYLTLFVAAVVFLGDAIFVIYQFLTGEVTTRFLLKALTVAAVSAAIFLFYLHDIEDGTDAR